MSDIKNFMGWDTPGVALITGASSGMGAEFAHQLAAQGFNTILVARRQERLDDLASSLVNDFSGNHEVLVADLSTYAGIDTVKQRIVATSNLNVLVNNAGFTTVGKFKDVPLQLQLDMINVHILATVQLTKAALPSMVDRKRGVIINVASLAAFMFQEGSVMYCATKTFLRSFSEALAMELRGTKVHVQALCPGYTRTELFETEYYKSMGFDASTIVDEKWMTSMEVVKTSLDAFQSKAVTVVPGTQNEETAKNSIKKQINDWERASKKKRSLE